MSDASTDEIECPLGCGKDLQKDKLREHYLKEHPDYDGLKTQPVQSLQPRTDRDWMIEGTSHISGLGGLPDRVLDMHETERYAVFSDGEALLLVPDDEVNP